MRAGLRVTSEANLPVGRAGRASTHRRLGAGGCPGAARRGLLAARLLRGVVQRHHVLLILAARRRTEAADADVERPVLPDCIVEHQWNRVAEACAGGPMTLRTGLRSGRLVHVGHQHRTVLDAHQAGDLRAGLAARGTARNVGHRR